MRKRNKLKKHSCKLCKPWKMCVECRWTKKELLKLKEHEKERLEVINT